MKNNILEISLCRKSFVNLKAKTYNYYNNDNNKINKDPSGD